MMCRVTETSSESATQVAQAGAPGAEVRRGAVGRAAGKARELEVCGLWRVWVLWLRWGCGVAVLAVPSRKLISPKVTPGERMLTWRGRREKHRG